MYACVSQNTCCPVCEYKDVRGQCLLSTLDFFLINFWVSHWTWSLLLYLGWLVCNPVFLPISSSFLSTQVFMSLAKLGFPQVLKLLWYGLYWLKMLPSLSALNISNSIINVILIFIYLFLLDIFFIYTSNVITFPGSTCPNKTHYSTPLSLLLWGCSPTHPPNPTPLPLHSYTLGHKAFTGPRASCVLLDLWFSPTDLWEEYGWLILLLFL